MGLKIPHGTMPEPESTIMFLIAIFALLMCAVAIVVIAVVYW